MMLALSAVGAAPRSTHAQEADVILRNARIWTGDSVQPYAEAVAKTLKAGADAVKGLV